MASRISWVLLIVLIGLHAHPAAAQQCSSSWATTLFWWGDTVPPGSVCGPGPGNFMFVCSVPTTTCPPPLVWCPTCGKFIAAAGAPINLTNGNVYIQESDVKVPGLGGGLSLNRTWNSIWPSSQSGQNAGIFGSNWRSTYEERVYSGSGTSAGYMVYLKSDGGIWYFSTANQGATWTLASPSNSIATLINTNNQYWTLTFQSGEKRTFSYSGGSLTSIVDRNGNVTLVGYDGSNRLSSVTDPAGRHIYFGYAGQRVSSVTTDVGISLGYLYDSLGRLSQVTKPDQTVVHFTYDGQSRITAVTDNEGKILESHTYDALGRGLTSSRAGGVEAVTVSYPY